MARQLSTKDFAAKLLAGAAVVLTLAGCATASKPVPALRAQAAKRIAGPAHLMEAHIPVGEFTILAYERVVNKGAPVTVYLEGDGAINNTDLSMPSGDPTPIYPVGLRMAADDATANVIYLARPCQYTTLMGVRACAVALATTHRYSPQILDAVNAALDNIKTRYDVPSFNLVGYEGGAAVAVELAAVRTDVKSLKTVAGVLDTHVKDDGWKMDPYAASLNPLDAAPRVASIPQEHSTAGWDMKRSSTMIRNFMAAEGNPSSAIMNQSSMIVGPDETTEGGEPQDQTAQKSPQPLK